MGKKKALVVLGLGYGDEGKGITTDYLSIQNQNAIIIRFNGGHQAGHTVFTKDGLSHVFSSFGAGTFRGHPTYWSKYCTFSPIDFMEELESLAVLPKIFVDYQSPITTHYDVLFNRAIEATRGDNRLGSCGVGFGATIERNDEEVNFTALDLLSDDVLSSKLINIREYYRAKVNEETIYSFDDFDHKKEDEIFRLAARNLRNLNFVKFIDEKEVFQREWDTYIFEGAQGILLDRTYGVQPYITKSNTTSENAFEILSRYFSKEEIITEVYYVTRCYQTRHGQGPFPIHTPSLELVNTQYETNINNEYQGDFKVNYFNPKMINNAIEYDSKFSKDSSRNLVVTCIDHISPTVIPVIIRDEIKLISLSEIFKLIEYSFDNILISKSPFTEDMTFFYSA